MNNELPDFDAFYSLTEQIRDLMVYAAILDNTIKDRESKLHQRFMTDPTLFGKDNKPLSTTAIKSAYEFCGFNDEIVNMRNELAKAKADLEKAKLRFDVMKMQVDVYRTDAANKRYSV